MRRHWKVRALRFVLLGVMAVAVLGFVTMTLWNWLMPALFGWRVIGFGQALGLLVLSRLLLGGFHGGRGGPMRWRHRMRERWERMTPEERERFRESLRGCGGSRPPEEAPSV
jgi:hypothetical protein